MALLRAVRDRLRFWRWYLTEYIPIAGGAEGDADKDTDRDEDAADADADKDEAGDDDDADKDADADKVEKDDDWQAKARKHERAAKKARKEAEEAARKLKALEDADKSEQEKAIEKAKEEGRKEASTEAEKARRSDRLEVAVTRLAAKGFKVGEDEDAKTVRFRDAEDALVNIERSLGDEVDEDDIYDSEGKVNADALQAALAELAERKPHLVEDGKTPKPSGDADGGKGTGGKGSGGSKSVEDMSAQEHFERIRRNK